ncbi:nicotinamide mononucleotide NMN deamidase PncC [Klosneuvirus KNV1]|uniref:Nicotinamide mononucleotide NMN deamidase PncC n=1 Tax=Klosneuvirus KNV1 TaxID=1977640 RepID=A0A1V0SHK4_9VIRU|nr:nicotinamide mononucleotide NMN deamidase PncC [Klosneuvirus KNV1]
MEWISQFDKLTFSDEIELIKSKAHLAGYNLLKTLHQHNQKLTLITAESLTGGLIFSTLVDIPFGGIHKYGCISVYNSESKNMFLDVITTNIYSHKCAKEMAINALLKSKATIAISATGNAMPQEDKKEHLGEVFIGIAGYVNDNTIKVTTQVYNFCYYENMDKNINLKTIIHNKINIPFDILDNYNDLQLTSLMAQYIRYATVERALNICQEYINNNHLIIPSICTQITILCEDNIINNDDGNIRKLLDIN